MHEWAGDERRPFLTVELMRHTRDIPLLTPLPEVTYLIYDADTHEVRVPGEAHSITELRSAVADISQGISRGWGKIIEDRQNA